VIQSFNANNRFDRTGHRPATVEQGFFAQSQGVQMRDQGEAVHYLCNPAGVTAELLR